MTTEALVLLSTAVDRLRETQIRHTVMLEEILGQVKSLKASASSQPASWLPFLKPIVSLAVQSATGVLAVAYALKGGDIVTAMQTLLKLL